MAEAFGVAAGVMGMASLFTTAVQCVGYIQNGRYMEQELGTGTLLIGLAQLRLSRWGSAVGIYHDDKLGRPDATPSELNIAYHALHQIQTLVLECESTSEKVGPRNPGDSSPGAGDVESALASVDGTLASIVDRHSPGRISMKRRGSWALYHKDHFKGLVDKITRLIDDLERAFPPPGALEIAKRDLEEITLNIAHNQRQKILEAISQCALEQDKMLHQATIEDCDMKLGPVLTYGQALVRNGNFVAPEWAGQTNLPILKAKIQVESIDARDKSRVMNGTTYGSSHDSFWDN